jgi:hypothetical protein
LSSQNFFKKRIYYCNLFSKTKEMGDEKRNVEDWSSAPPGFADGLADKTLGLGFDTKSSPETTSLNTMDALCQQYKFCSDAVTKANGNAHNTNEMKQKIVKVMEIYWKSCILSAFSGSATWVSLKFRAVDLQKEAIQNIFEVKAEHALVELRRNPVQEKGLVNLQKNLEWLLWTVSVLQLSRNKDFLHWTETLSKILKIN